MTLIYYVSLQENEMITRCIMHEISESSFVFIWLYRLISILQVNSQLLLNISNYVGKLMSVFGVPLGDKSTCEGQVRLFICSCLFTYFVVTVFSMASAELQVYLMELLGTPVLQN